jgi:hypothetical protein
LCFWQICVFSRAVKTLFIFARLPEFGVLATLKRFLLVKAKC